ncbi:MAG: hypothetical protein OEY97_13010, partial [Nitrospirota bacterium]|nr:hypothetical protein [Nitrospirota bacterium]
MAYPPDKTPPPPGPPPAGWYDGTLEPTRSGLPPGSFPAGYGVDIIPGGPGATLPPDPVNPARPGERPRDDFFARPEEPPSFFRRALAFVLDIAIC